VIVISSERVNLILNGESVLIQEPLGSFYKIMVSDWSMRDCKLACFLVRFIPVRNRRSRHYFYKIVIYESAIASTNVKVNRFARSVGVFLIFHNNNIVWFG
jgi:hypothetical protein